MSRTMKDSGIPWIGEIPEGWRKDKIIRVFRTIGSGTTPKSTEESNFGGDINWIQSGDINGGVMSSCKNQVSEETLLNCSALKVYKFPFIIVAMYGASVGNTSISTIDGCVNQACCVLGDSVLNFKYAFSIIKSCKDYWLIKAIGGGQPNISQETIRQTWIPVPPLAEQHLIATFLDKKCSEIDSLIDLQEQMIEELKAYKQSVIIEAVTKGLNPAAPMRDSGIEWIGQIPEHWRIATIGRLFNIYAGGDAKWEFYSDTCDTEHPYPVYTNTLDRHQTYAYTSKPMFNGDTITVTGRGDIGHAFYRREPFDAIIRLLVLDKKYNLDCRYFAYFIEDVIHFFTNSAAIGQLSAVQVTPYAICHPTLAEQQAIADYLDKKCGEIDELITIKQQKIESLKEYKKSVIYEYVTGKREV